MGNSDGRTRGRHTEVAPCTRECKDNTPALTAIRDLESGAEKKLLVPLRAARWSNDRRSSSLVVMLAAGRVESEMFYICPAGSGAPCEKLTIGYNPISVKRRVRSFTLCVQASFHRLPSFGASIEKDRREVHLADLGPMYPIGHIFRRIASGEIAYTKFKPGENELWLARLFHQLRV